MGSLASATVKPFVQMGEFDTHFATDFHARAVIMPLEGLTAQSATHRRFV
jgi:hypothetical protein